MTRAAIRVRDLTKVFALAVGGGKPVSLLDALRAGKPVSRTREIRALDGVSFDIVEGERVGVIGPNGAGKTTLLSILANVAFATSGHVKVEGDVHAMLSIGTVLRDDLTGRQNIEIDASIHGRETKDVEAARDRIIAFSELGEFIDRPVQTYSTGMKSRLAFSMGAFINPDILIIDETLSVGDAFFSQKASQRMRELATSGRIVIMVSHGLRSIVEMCSRCIWIDQGKIVIDGDPKVVTEAYERSVRQTDEAELVQKFGQIASSSRRDEGGTRLHVSLLQDGGVKQTVLAAMQPLEIRVRGNLNAVRGKCGLELLLLRVDGRVVWRHTSENAGISLAKEGAFEARITMDPFILGADLYRLEVNLLNERGNLDSAARVFKVVDEEGQYGGVPLLLYSPRIKARAVGKVGS